MATVRELMVFRVRLLLDVASLIDHNIWVVGRGELDEPFGVVFNTSPLPRIFVVTSFFFALKAEVGVTSAGGVAQRAQLYQQSVFMLALPLPGMMRILGRMDTGD